MEYETFNSIQTKQEMLNHIKNIKYLVIYPDKTRHFYKSLREIGKNICIDSSTISKKMQETEDGMLAETRKKRMPILVMRHRITKYITAHMVPREEGETNMQSEDYRKTYTEY